MLLYFKGSMLHLHMHVIIVCYSLYFLQFLINRPIFAGLLQVSNGELLEHDSTWTGYPSYHAINSIKALKAYVINAWHATILVIFKHVREVFAGAADTSEEAMSCSVTITCTWPVKSSISLYSVCSMMLTGDCTALTPISMSCKFTQYYWHFLHK